jgi:cyclopropane fatty-acyl-phospholipid synthase-like methyltransferase
MQQDGTLPVSRAPRGMGVIENPPASTDSFYGDDYYGGAEEGYGYVNYQVTAEHTQLWTRLMTEALSPGGRVLNIGCADGFALSHLRGNYELFGIEANAAAAAAAKATQKGVNVISSDLFSGDIKKFAFFDIITSIATFEHVLDFRGAFELSLNFLKPDGILIFDVPLMSETEDNRVTVTGSTDPLNISFIQRSAA